MRVFALWYRLRPLLSFYKQKLGFGGILKTVFSAFAISLFELAGLALVFPFIKIVTDVDFHNRVVELLVDAPLGGILANYSHTVLFFGLAVIFVYILQGWINGRLTLYQANIAARINSMASDSLVTSALASRYQLFVEHSAVNIASVSYSNTTHGALVFRSLVAAFNEIVLLGIICFGLFVVSPFVFLFLVILVFILAVGIFLPLSRRVAKIGRQTREMDKERHRFVFTMASAIRDIKIMGLEKAFTLKNRALATTHAYITASYITLGATVRMAVEVILVCGIVAASIWFSWNGSALAEAAPIIVTFGLVVIRLAPALSRLAGAYNGFLYSLPFVEGLLELQKVLARYPQNRMHQSADFPGEYRAEKLCFSYGGRQVLTECSISIGPGEVVAVVGPSGSGKSTLLDILTGLMMPSSGEFFLGGVQFSPFVSKTFPARLGYVPQSIAILDGSLAFNIALEELPDSVRLQEAVQRASLGQWLNTLPEGLQTLLGDGGQGLSGGQRQRLGIARALYRQPALLVLDEVTSALDDVTAQEVMAELMAMRGNTSLLFVTHDLRKVVMADRVYQLHKGRLTVLHV